MVQALERPFTYVDVFDLILNAGPMTADAIARWCGLPIRHASSFAERLLDEGFVDRDESGAYAVWCRWPRVGL